MPTRKLIVLAAALLSFTQAQANEPQKKDKAEVPATATGAKAGEACKKDADCDQSGRAMICGRGKCEYDVSKMPVKT